MIFIHLAWAQSLYNFFSSSPKLFDPDEEGYIEYDNFATPIQAVLQIEDKYIKLIYKDMDSQQTEKVTRGM